MDRITKLIEDALNGDTGPKVRVIRGNSFADLLAQVSEDCGEKDCPIHGSTPLKREDDENLLGPEDLEGMDSKTALQGALGSTALAHNYLVAGKATEARLEQLQADLWLRLSEAFANQEIQQRLAAQEADWAARNEAFQPEPKAAEPDSRSEDETVS
jgi:hypothetical protein